MPVSRGRRLAQSWLAGCSRVERAVTFIAFCAVIAVVFADVVSRELTGAGLHWARQAGVYANLVVVMFGLGLASASGAHLRPRFADGWLPAAWRPWLERIADALMALFCIGFATVAAGVVFDSWQLGERSTVLRTPVWPVQAVIPLAFALVALRHALYAAYPALRPRSAALPPVPARGEAERR
ncbi:MAG: TRAP transporter small permease [Gammaproteobacteria bacterium]|nr:MAG: TRAP transporter small permease [Gammaproteobacteria bacterium]